MNSWQRYQRLLCQIPAIPLSVDISRMGISDDDIEHSTAAFRLAFEAMDALERGAIANPDENRMVGHYWLRAPERAPSPAIAEEIHRSLAAIRVFSEQVHVGRVQPPTAPRFTQMLLVGIGGSALGPMLVADALGDPRRDRMAVSFIDNTDPDGVARTLSQLDGKLKETLCVVTSKSGGTPETRNGMLLVADVFRQAGLEFGRHAVAITMPGSPLDQTVARERWLARFPMFDWIGGRTSVLSAVGLLPAALQGIDIDAMLAGAAACDEATRIHDVRRNPAAALALAWHHATRGRGEKDMVVIPYKDRLLLLSRYLQQLIMESIGKEIDLRGRQVLQGLTVYGNKGSTDQHAYVQQLRDGIDNFFVAFIRVLDSGGSELQVEPGITAGDYLHGFLLGTRQALGEKNRQSLTITVARVDPRSVGALIALFERAVGLYASLIGINAYHQPGVEAGKQAAAQVLRLQAKVIAALSDVPQTSEQIARNIGAADSIETVFELLEYLAANGRATINLAGSPDKSVFSRKRLEFVDSANGDG